MKIRLQKIEDATEIARLHRATIRHINSNDYSQDIIEVWSARTSASRFKNLDTVKRWVAIEDEKIICFCDHDFKGELLGLYVHKDHLGKQVGTKLLKKAEDSMKKMGFKEIKMEATVTAKPFYEKKGYKVIKQSFHKIEDKKIQVFIMKKHLK